MHRPLLLAALLVGCDPGKSDPPGVPSDTAMDSPVGDTAGVPDLLINELCAANSTVLADADGDFADWVELVSASGAGADLSGWSLVQGDEALVFPVGTSMAPGEYLLVWATGAAGGAPFRLSADGEALSLRDADGALVDTVRWGRQRENRSWGRGEDGDWYAFAVPTPGAANDTAPTAPMPTPSSPGGYQADPLALSTALPGALIRYTTDGSAPTEDSALYTGPLAIGAADEGAQADSPGVWTFSEDPGLLTRQDGSDEDFRSTLADGTLTVTMTREAAVQRLYLPLPDGPYGDADTFHVRTRFRVRSGDAASVELGFFRSDGANVAGGELAALDWYGSAHGVAGYIGDSYAAGVARLIKPMTWYVAELDGSPSDPSFAVRLFASDGATLLDSVRTATAGLGEGIDVFGFANEDRSADDGVETVEFDWVTWAVNAELPADPASSVPPVRVVRARVWADGWDPSEIYTGVFLDGDPGPLPTAALVADPVDLWDDATGIYANPLQTGSEWERPATLVWMEDGVEVWQREIGLRIQGNGGRSAGKKSFRLIVDPSYGGSTLDEAVLPSRDEKAYTTLVLASGSNDASTAAQGARYADVWTLLRDAVATDLYQDIAPIAIAPPRAVRLALDGDPWGLYSLKEHIDGDFVARHAGWEDVDLIQNLSEVKEGDAEAWDRTWALFETGDLSDPAAWSAAEAGMDLPWLATYGLFNGWADNTDWPTNNTWTARPRETDGVWTWIPWDTEAAMGSDDTKTADDDGVALLRTLMPLQRALDGGPDDYDAVYAERWLLLRNLTLRPDLYDAALDARADEIRDDLAYETDRWGSSPAIWEANVLRMREFADARDDRFWDQVRAQVGGADDVAVVVDASSGGSVQLFERPIPALPCTLRWLADQPVTLTAVPDEGYTFVGWEGLEGEGSAVAFTPEIDTMVRAVFEPEP